MILQTGGAGKRRYLTFYGHKSGSGHVHMLTSCHFTQFHHEQCFNSYKHQIVKEWYITLRSRNIFHNKHEYLEETRIMNILTSYSAYYMTCSIQNSVWISFSNSRNIWHQTRTPWWDRTNNMPQFLYLLLTAIGLMPGGSVYKRDIHSTKNEEKSSEALQKKTLQLFHQCYINPSRSKCFLRNYCVIYIYILRNRCITYNAYVYIWFSFKATHWIETYTTQRGKFQSCPRIFLGSLTATGLEVKHC
jgi:hypothetical protein